MHLVKTALVHGLDPSRFFNQSHPILVSLETTISHDFWPHSSSPSQHSLWKWFFFTSRETGWIQPNESCTSDTSVILKEPQESFLPLCLSPILLTAWYCQDLTLIKKCPFPYHFPRLSLLLCYHLCVLCQPLLCFWTPKLTNLCLSSKSLPRWDCCHWWWRSTPKHLIHPFHVHHPFPREPFLRRHRDGHQGEIARTMVYRQWTSQSPPFHFLSLLC